ncbi:hypothetical protein [Anaplasma capra]|uniref:hypothetical protein n=1 Tax=Anaplasma capra TaxID=1562740 RepID=UPI0021D5E64A|nr:hypothetical protein [Anaplasma capra]MCU7612217.1 hypothetical protein [Anaplasma capra]
MGNNLVKGIANEIIGQGADHRVVNEVVIRAILFALLQGRAPKYRLRVQRRARGFRYLYDVSRAGHTVRYEKLREMCARDTVVRDVASGDGLESLCRYAFSIVAFMPEHVGDLLFSLGAGSGNCSEIVDTIEKLHGAVARLKKMRKCGGDGCQIQWGKVYTIFRRSFCKAVDSSSPAELECFAYKVFSSKACDVVSEKLSNLSHILEQELIEENAAEVSKLLGFLSNFDARLEGYHELCSTSEESCKEFFLGIDIAGVQQAIKDCGMWHRSVGLITAERIRKCARVNANTLAAISMLLNMHLEISSCNVEAIIHCDGSIAYTFARDFSFPFMKTLHYGHIDEGILASPAGRCLVDLMIKNHNSREVCKFPLSYSEIAAVIRCLNEMMQDPRARERVAYYIHEALCRNPEGSTNVYRMSMELVSQIHGRLQFLQKFVDSPDYKCLAEFLMQSQCSDTNEHFRRFLVEKRGYAVLPSVSKQKAKALSGKAVTTLIYVGYAASLLLLAGGIGAIGVYCVYASGLQGDLAIAIGGGALLLLGIVAGVVTRLTDCRREKAADEHRASERGASCCHPEEVELVEHDAEHDDCAEEEITPPMASSKHLIPVTIECSASINNSIGSVGQGA